MTDKLTLFEDLEVDKENYKIQRQGRSASLISRLNHTSEANIKLQKEEYWREILNKVQTADDPLPLFTQCIEFESHQIKSDWTSRRSKLLDINELCLLYCEKFDKYKNDPKFLNVWLDYCLNFYSNEEQIDVLVYMYRSSIANQLADFYSYFVDILVLLERYQEAYEVIQLGIQSGAKPERQLQDELGLLQRDYSQEIQLNNSSDVNSLSLDQIVTYYNEPSLILNQDRNRLIREYHVRNESSPSMSLNPKRATSVDVYVDNIEDDSSNVNDKLILQLTDSELKFQSRNERLKENKSMITGKFEPNTSIAPLKPVDCDISEERKHTDKLSIFNDDLNRNGPIFKMIFIDGMKPEKIDCNFKLIYPQDGIEYSFEELLAQSRRKKRSISNSTQQNKKLKT